VADLQTDYYNHVSSWLLAIRRRRSALALQGLGLSGGVRTAPPSPVPSYAFQAAPRPRRVVQLTPFGLVAVIAR
jgi:hypothetical protein